MLTVAYQNADNFREEADTDQSLLKIQKIHKQCSFLILYALRQLYILAWTKTDYLTCVQNKIDARVSLFEDKGNLIWRLYLWILESYRRTTDKSTPTKQYVLEIPGSVSHITTITIQFITASRRAITSGCISHSKLVLQQSPYYTITSIALTLRFSWASTVLKNSAFGWGFSF